MKVNGHTVKVVNMYLSFKARQPKSQQIKALNFKYMYKSKFCKTSLHSRTVNSKEKWYENRNHLHAILNKLFICVWNFVVDQYICKSTWPSWRILNLDPIIKFYWKEKKLFKCLSLSTTFHYTLRRFVVNTLTIRSSLNFDIW